MTEIQDGYMAEVSKIKAPLRVRMFAVENCGIELVETGLYNLMRLEVHPLLNEYCVLEYPY
jgi:hypothetical protein